MMYDDLNILHYTAVVGTRCEYAYHPLVQFFQISFLDALQYSF